MSGHSEVVAKQPKTLHTKKKSKARHRWSKQELELDGREDCLVHIPILLGCRRSTVGALLACYEFLASAANPTSMPQQEAAT